MHPDTSPQFRRGLPRGRTVLRFPAHTTLLGGIGASRGVGSAAVDVDNQSVGHTKRGNLAWVPKASDGSTIACVLGCVLSARLPSPARPHATDCLSRPSPPPPSRTRIALPVAPAQTLPTSRTTRSATNSPGTRRAPSTSLRACSATTPCGGSPRTKRFHTATLESTPSRRAWILCRHSPSCTDGISRTLPAANGLDGTRALARRPRCRCGTRCRPLRARLLATSTKRTRTR